MISTQSRKTVYKTDTSSCDKHGALKPREIKWCDFCGKVDKNSKYSAHTYWKIKYSYDPIESNGRVFITAHVDCVFDKRMSWAKHETKTDELLKHEQGHYNIGFLCALEFKKRVMCTEFSTNKYQKEVSDIFSKTLNEFLEFEIKYDEQTDHFKNKQAQKLWDRDIESRLLALKNYW